MTTSKIFRQSFYLTLAVFLAVYSVTAEDSKTKSAKFRDSRLDVEITLNVPTNWKAQKPTSRLRLGQFDIPAAKDDKEAAELAIYSFGGGGGGINANIKRWVGQFESEGRSVKVTEGKSPQGPYVVVDLKGTYRKPTGPPFQQKTVPTPGSRMLAIILTVEKKANFFLKLTGPEKTVTATEAAFRKSFSADKSKEKLREF